jgi:hypothetical protein
MDEHSIAVMQGVESPQCKFAQLQQARGGSGDDHFLSIRSAWKWVRRTFSDPQLRVQEIGI